MVTDNEVLPNECDVSEDEVPTTPEKVWMAARWLALYDRTDDEENTIYSDPPTGALVGFNLVGPMTIEYVYTPEQDAEPVTRIYCGAFEAEVLTDPCEC